MRDIQRRMGLEVCRVNVVRTCIRARTSEPAILFLVHSYQTLLLVIVEVQAFVFFEQAHL